MGSAMSLHARPGSLPRTIVDMEAEVRGDTRSFMARARDISAHGVRLRGPLRVAPGERVWLILVLPGGERISAPAEGRWDREESAGTWVSGVQFVPGTESQSLVCRLACDLEAGRLAAALRRNRTQRLPPIAAT